MPSDPAAAVAELLRRRAEYAFSYVAVGADAVDTLARSWPSSADTDDRPMISDEGDPVLDPDVRRALDTTALAHLATVLPDGSPHVVPLWIGVHDDRIVFFTGPQSRKARNLHRDPRVALSLTVPDRPFEPVLVRGRVSEWIDGDDGWRIIDALSTKYVGQPYPRDQERVAAVIEPDFQKVGLG